MLLICKLQFGVLFPVLDNARIKSTHIKNIVIKPNHPSMDQLKGKRNVPKI